MSGIERKQNKISDEIEGVNLLQNDIDKRVDKIEKTISELKNIKILSGQRDNIKKYIDYEDWITKADIISGKLNTKPITDLGGRAWKQLVSDSFKKKFEKEIGDLNAPNVNLDFHGEYGSQLREKNLEGITKIDDFLSEGEQKAVALADFFAEISMQDKKTPVVFDDPATSFDHDRKEKIAERIVQESDSRQIIVFTHDLMFASYIHAKVEKNGDLDSSKAFFHDLRAERSKVGLVTQDYYSGSTKFDADIRKIESRIPNLESLTGEEKMDGIKSCYSMLRRTVEKAVEERIFGGIITRWTERIQMHNVSKASMSKEKLDKARLLHDQFSAYTDAHYQSNEMIQNSTPSIDSLKDDIQQVKDVAVR